MTLLTLSLLLSLPQPETAKPAPTPKTAIPSAAAMAAGRRVNLLDCSSMVPLLLPGSIGRRSFGGLY